MTTQAITSWPLTLDQTPDWPFAVELMARLREVGMTHAGVFAAFDSAKVAVKANQLRSLGMGLCLLVNQQQIPKAKRKAMQNPTADDEAWQTHCEYVRDSVKNFGIGRGDIVWVDVEFFHPYFSSLHGLTRDEHTNATYARAEQLREAIGPMPTVLFYGERRDAVDWEGWPPGCGDSPLFTNYNMDSATDFCTHLNDKGYQSGDPTCVSFSYCSNPERKGPRTWDTIHTGRCARMIAGAEIVIEYPGPAHLAAAKELFPAWSDYADYYATHLEALVRGLRLDRKLGE